MIEAIKYVFMIIGIMTFAGLFTRGLIEILRDIHKAARNRRIGL
jgi:hypothetical protein